jgi:hypothetical protein
VTALGIEAVVASTNGRIPTPAIEAHSPIGESSPTTSIGVGLDEIVARTGHDADVLERVLAEEVEVGNVVVVDGLFALAPDGLDPEIVRALQQITPLNILRDPESDRQPERSSDDHDRGILGNDEGASGARATPPPRSSPRRALPRPRRRLRTSR